GDRSRLVHGPGRMDGCGRGRGVLRRAALSADPRPRSAPVRRLRDRRGLRPGSRASGVRAQVRSAAASARLLAHNDPRLHRTLTALAVPAIGSQGENEEKEKAMAEGVELIRRFYDEVLGQGNLDLLDELSADDFVDHAEGLPGQPEGIEGVRFFVNSMRDAFP